MFWKKKTKPAVREDLIDDLDDQRASFRYIFKKADRPTMNFNGKTVCIYDISAGGLAFENIGFSKYDVDRVCLHLDMPNFPGDPVLSAQVRILHVTEKQICHSIFEDCTIDEYEMIHKYVLEMQKKDLKQG